MVSQSFQTLMQEYLTTQKCKGGTKKKSISKFSKKIKVFCFFEHFRFDYTVTHSFRSKESEYSECCISSSYFSIRLGLKL